MCRLLGSIPKANSSPSPLGQKQMMRLNCDKYLDQRTCCLVSSLVVVNFFEIFVIGDDVDQRSWTFKVVSPDFEGFEDHE